MAAAQTYQSEFTGSQMDERFRAVATLAEALTVLEQAIAAKYTKPADGIPSTDMDASVQSALALALTSVQSLADYYTKSEVDSIAAAIAATINATSGEVVASLPTASASTLGKIYYVGPTSGEYDRYVTSYDGTTYSWLQIGTTDVDMTQYATKAELSQLDKKFSPKDSGYDFAISDENGYDIVQFANGGIKTKNFDSAGYYGGYSRRTAFKVKVDTTNYLPDEFVAHNVNTYEAQVIYEDNAVLYLPKAYTKKGKPTKVILYCKHGASTITQASDDILTGSMGKIFRYMLACGYAILGADGLPDGWAASLGLCERVVGNYVAVQSMQRAWDYAVNNFNLDKSLAFIFGYSQGGHYAQNVIDNTNIPIAAAAELSPVCSMRYHQWDLNGNVTIGGATFTKGARLNIARIFGYSAVTTDAELLALEYDATKEYGFDPWTRNVDNPFSTFVQEGDLWVLPNDTPLADITMKKHIKCPVKIWCAENDDVLGVDVMKVFVKAIKNSGQVADLELYSTGGHDIPSAQTSIGTFTENEESVNLYPIAKDVATWFYRFGGYELLNA